MKRIIYSGLSLIFAVLMLTSCDKKNTDLMTGDVKTGGILTPTASFPYKLGGTTDFDITLTVPKGPGIVSIEIYRTYTGKTVEVLDQTVAFASANATEGKTVNVSYNYAKLSDGLSMPA